MNKKQFETFRTWRLKKYEIDLGKLRNDLANRGLAHSSIRNQEEAWLKEECDAEIVMKKIDSEEYEKEKKDKRRERLVFIVTNATLAAVALISLFFSYVSCKQ